jgi:hypothetical protein
MNRFTEIIKNLRITRVQIVEENRASKARGKRGSGKRKRKPRELVFDSPELEAIFKSMPEECKALIRDGK